MVAITKRLRFQLAKLVMRMQHKGGGVKTFKQHVRGAESNEKCPLSSSCSTAGVDGAFTPTAIVEWIMENLSLESHLGKLKVVQNQSCIILRRELWKPGHEAPAKVFVICRKKIYICCLRKKARPQSAKFSGYDFCSKIFCC